MPAHVETFCQTTDLYLEMLREAQRVEDKKLVALIRRRLKHAALLYGRPPAAKSFVFPGTLIPRCPPRSKICPSGRDSASARSPPLQRSISC